MKHKTNEAQMEMGRPAAGFAGGACSRSPSETRRIKTVETPLFSQMGKREGFLNEAFPLQTA